ncbi:MAG: hypothetical protein R3328_09550, partial [Planococcaceae bacterium]|nr:hypothetical protein [Planococcaceae bacterium]
MNKIMSGFLVSIMALPVFATDLADLRLHIMNTFTDSAQTHYPNGTFNRYSNAQVLGDEDSRLDFKSDNNHWGDNFSCGAKKCEITGSVRDPVSLPDFQLSNESKNYSSYDECKKGNDTLKKFSYGNVEVGGCSVKFPSGLKARNVQVNSDGIITLEQGFYWFESFTLNNSAKLEIDGPVTIFVKNNFHLNSDALVNIEGETQDLLFVSYSEDNIAMDNNARLNGFIYAEGNLQLNGSASIAGRVNLNNLTLNNKSIIEGASSVVDAGSGTLHHYELHFNSCNADLTVKACGDENCSINNLYSDKATVHVKNQDHPPKNLYKFKDFNGQASTSIAKEANQLNYYFELGYQTNGKGNLSPKPLNDLVCYVDGIRTCKVNGQSNGSGRGPLTLKVDTAFAADNAPISFSGNCLASNATVEVEFGFDSSASGFAGPVTIHWPGHVETLNTGQKKPLILPVSGATLSYPRADLLTLSARKVLPEGGYAGDAVTDLVAFVPASWKVQQGVNCGDNGGFKYNDHADSCTVLGAAGGAVDFAVAALD